MKAFKKVFAILLVGICMCCSGCVNKQVEKAMIRDLKKADAQQAGLVTLNIDDKYVLKDIIESEDGNVENLYYDDMEGSEGLIYVGVTVGNEEIPVYELIEVMKLMQKFNYRTENIDDMVNAMLLDFIQENPESRKVLVDIGNNLVSKADNIRGNNALVIQGYSSKYNTSLIIAMLGDGDYLCEVVGIKRDSLENTYKDVKNVIGSINYNGKIPDIEFEDYDESEVSVSGILHKAMVEVDGEVSNETYEFDSDLNSIDSIME